MRTVLVFGLLVIVTSAILLSGTRLSIGNNPNKSAVSGEIGPRLQEAASFIVNRYDARVGLVSEAEDDGSNVPDNTSCWRTFWVYDDNLWSSEALKPYNPAMAENVSRTVARYANKCGNSDLFEVVLGRIILTTIHDRTKVSVDYFIFEGLNYTVWADRHQPQDGGIFFDADQYADLCFYLSLDYILLGNKVASEQWFRTGESFWNGNGFLDKAVNQTDPNATFQNYKLGLYLFTARATGFASSICDAVENKVWSYQKNETDSRGGIASQSYLNGTIYGTANIETTSILLLAYNIEALARFDYMKGLKFGAYYYLWYGISFNEHWDQGIKYSPLLGRYNSSDPAVADEQILLAKQHGIDFFAVSWMGKGNWTPPDQDFSIIDQNLVDGLLKAPHISNFSFCLLYETKIVLDEVNTLIRDGTDANFTDVFISDLEYAARQYFSNPSYLRTKGDPIFFVYNVPHLYGNFSQERVDSARSMLDSARQRMQEMGIRLYLVGDMNEGPEPPGSNSPCLYSMNATTSYLFDSGETDWRQLLGNASAYYPQWLSNMTSSGREFFPDAYPGFDNTDNCLYKTQNNIPSNNGTLLPLNESMFKQMLDVAVNYSSSNPKIVMITSWNEWLESTAIEPSVEHGELFLDQVLFPITIPEANQTVLLISLLLPTILIAAVCRNQRLRRMGY